MSYTMNGASFIDSINDRGSEETRHINHIIRQGLIQFIALDYEILKQVRLLREQIESINDPYLLGDTNGNSQISIGLPMLASLNLNSLFLVQESKQAPDPAEIKKFRSLAKILYRIYSERYYWIVPDKEPKNESWIDESNSELKFNAGLISIINCESNYDESVIKVVIDWCNREINPKILFIREDPYTSEGRSVQSSVKDQVGIPLQVKNVDGTLYAFTVEIYNDMIISNPYTKYRIAQLLQGIWSYSILYPRTFYDLSPNYKDIKETADNFPEQSDPKYLRGVEEAKRKTRAHEFLNNLEDASSGIPLQDEIKEILRNIVLRIGNIPLFNFASKTVEDISVSDPRYDDYEDNNEINIVRSLLIPGKPQSPFSSKPPFTSPWPGPDADQLIKEVGLENIFNQLYDLVQDDSSGGFNSEVFNNILDIWGRLFYVNAGTPDGINYIEKQLPPIEGSFRTIIPSTSQQDLFSEELDNVIDFLRSAIRQERLIDLRNVLNNPSPSMFINTFRSLRGLDLPAVLQPLPLTAPPIYYGFWSFYDNDNWFDYLFIIWWILTQEQKLSEIPDFASRREALRLGQIPGRSYPPEDINFDAMFPGSLSGPSIVLAGGPNQNIDQSNSSARLELEYATFERNLSSLDNQLARPGGFIRLTRSYGGLPI